MNVIHFNSNQKKRILILFISLFMFYTFIRWYRMSKKPESDSSEIGGFLIQTKRGLSFHKRKFYLDGKEFRLYGGALHYFRVVPEYWNDRLLKLRAMGLNTVETYCPWNLHEEVRGTYNFEGILNLRAFVKQAQNLGLYVILRPGPYICSEWEFGGLPSWLLRDPNMKVRSMYFGFTKAVDDYFKQLMHEIGDLQYSKGGPIIAFQVENEYGTFGNNQLYIEYLATTMKKYGIVERLFVSDSDIGMHRVQPLKNGFVGINTNDKKKSENLIQTVKAMDPDFPIIITELWSGWFLTWGQHRLESVISITALQEFLEYVHKNQYSFIIYMFHGGTNFGFMNGATPDRVPMLTSYDYFAPLSESGDVTDKYLMIRKLMIKNLPSEHAAKVPDVPENIPSYEYGLITMTDYLLLDTLLEMVERPISVDHPLFMEELNVNSNSGQGYGFILYRTQFKKASNMTVKGRVYDRGIVLVNSNTINEQKIQTGVVTSNAKDPFFSLASAEKRSMMPGDDSDHTLDILVENMGRQNYADFQRPDFNLQRKGISGLVYLDSTPVKSWRIFPLEFKKSMVNKASSSEKWQSYKTLNQPALYRGFFAVDGSGKDTYVDMEGWIKGVVFINGFNLGRYWNVGPQRTLYLPAPLLRSGRNELLIFELHGARSAVRLVNKPVFDFKT